MRWGVSKQLWGLQSNRSFRLRCYCATVRVPALRAELHAALAGVARHHGRHERRRDRGAEAHVGLRTCRGSRYSPERVLPRQVLHAQAVCGLVRPVRGRLGYHCGGAELRVAHSRARRAGIRCEMPFREATRMRTAVARRWPKPRRPLAPACSDLASPRLRRSRASALSPNGSPAVGASDAPPCGAQPPRSLVVDRPSRRGRPYSGAVVLQSKPAPPAT